MRDRISAHLRTNIVGYIALFCFAMTGTALATHPGGANTISSGDIINAEVKTADIGTGEVGTADIATDGVRTIDLLDDAITQDKIIAGGVRTSEIANGQVTSVDVADNGLTGTDVADTDSLGPLEIGELGDAELGVGSVSRDEIANGTFFSGDIADTGFGDFEIPNNAVHSNEIVDGAVGGPDLNVLTRFGPNTTVPNTGAVTLVIADCDANEKALGGGVTNFGVGGVYVSQTFPRPDNIGGEAVPTGWGATVVNFGAPGDITANGWAVCAQEGTTGFGAKRKRD